MSPAEYVDSLKTDDEVASYYNVEVTKKDEKLQERVVQIRRVTKVVKGGKLLSFRAVVVCGDENGSVGVGVASAKEVKPAVAKAVTDAKRNIITVPITNVILKPASEGSGVVAGGAVR